MLQATQARILGVTIVSKWRKLKFREDRVSTSTESTVQFFCFKHVQFVHEEDCKAVPESNGLHLVSTQKTIL